MSKVILIKDSSWLVLLFLVVLVGCKKTIDKSELIFRSGKYYAKSSSKPYNGKVISYFTSGEIRGKMIFDDGLIEQSKSFGYEGELIGQSVYERIEGISIANDKIDRINFVSSHEAIDNPYFSIQVIVSDELPASEYEALKSNVMTEIQRWQYLDKIPVENLSFKISKGELEPSLFVSGVK